MAEPEPQAPDGNGGSGMELATRAEQEQDSIVIVGHVRDQLDRLRTTGAEPCCVRSGKSIAR